MMQVHILLQNRLKELPNQIRLLESTYGAISDSTIRSEKLRDLALYKKRMEDGIIYLLSLDDVNQRRMQDIYSPSRALISENYDRYSRALTKERLATGIVYDEQKIAALLRKLRKIPLLHASNSTDVLRNEGILPANALWLTPTKTTANAMDIALGLDHYVFFTHGFILSNFSSDWIKADTALLERDSTLVSAVDIFKLVLMRTKQTIPCDVETAKWVPVLSEYARNIFHGKDFLRLKASYRQFRVGF